MSIQPGDPRTVSAYLIELLAANGIDTVFGIPGLHTLELYRGLTESSVRHVLTRHEQGAGFAADGYAPYQRPSRRRIRDFGAGIYQYSHRRRAKLFGFGAFTGHRQHTGARHRTKWMPRSKL